MSNTQLDIRVYPIDNPINKVFAFASVTVDNMVAINGIRVNAGERGLFVSMPQSKDRNDNYHDTAFPISSDLRKEINQAVLKEYNYMARLNPSQRKYNAPNKMPDNDSINKNVEIDVKVHPINNPGNNLLAYANVVLNDKVAISGIRIIDSERDPFVSMPQSKDKENKYHDIAFPVTGDLRKELSQAILEEYYSLERNQYEMDELEEMEI